MKNKINYAEDKSFRRGELYLADMRGLSNQGKTEMLVVVMFLFEKGIGAFIVEDNRLYLPKQMDLASFVIKSVSELNQDGQQEESHD